MVDTIVLGGQAFTIYGTLLGAKAHFAARIGGEAWQTATSDIQKRSLVSAANLLNSFEDAAGLPSWTGTRTLSTQPLAWPRDGATCSDDAVPDGTTPAGVVIASYETAFAFVANADFSNQTSTGSLLKRAKAGSAEVEFFRSSIGSGSGQDLPLPQSIYRNISCLLSGGAGISTLQPTVTGNLTPSVFTVPSELDKGYA